MFSKRTAAITAMIFWIIVCMSVTIGAQVGYEADSPSEASVHWNGTHVEYGTGEVSEANTTVDDSRDVGDEPAFVQAVADATPNLRTPADPYIRSGVRGFTENLLKFTFTLSFGVANLSAGVFYHLQFIPMWVVAKSFEAAAFAPIVGFVGLYLNQVREVVR